MNAKEFMAKLEQDAKEENFTIMEQIQAAGRNPEAVYAIAKEAGVTDSFEVFQADMEAMYNEMAGELSEEELAAIAGGGDAWILWTALGVNTGGGLIALAVSAAA